MKSSLMVFAECILFHLPNPSVQIFPIFHVEIIHKDINVFLTGYQKNLSWFRWKHHEKVVVIISHKFRESHVCGTRENDMNLLFNNVSLRDTICRKFQSLSEIKQEQYGIYYMNQIKSSCVITLGIASSPNYTRTGNY